MCNAVVGYHRERVDCAAEAIDLDLADPRQSCRMPGEQVGPSHSTVPVERSNVMFRFPIEMMFNVFELSFYRLARNAIGKCYIYVTGCPPSFAGAGQVEGN